MKRCFKLISLCALSATFALPIAACGNEETKASLSNQIAEEHIIDDNYDNYYELFVYSFCDSDGNGRGDFNGVTQKLDYIRDMGYTGIWLMPIHPSPSYHKYDVRDYYDVDASYGTMEEFETLVEKAHEKGIKIIMDLVVNHSSSSCSWFTQAVEARRTGDTENKYYDYYNFSDQAQGGYAYTGNDNEGNPIYYEARFVGNMPDLNLDSEAVRAEISNILKFWEEKGVDGFRLDACTSYYTGDDTKSAQFITWLKNEAVKYNEDAYIVGEVLENSTRIRSFYAQSEADSFFWFPVSTNGSMGGSVLDTLRSKTPADRLSEVIEGLKGIGDGIAAPRLDNHDRGRFAAAAGKSVDWIKMGYGLLSVLGGNTFTYYGDEIGVLGSGKPQTNDPDKRVGMLWTEDTDVIYPPGVTTSLRDAYYTFGSVESQKADPDSILNYYKYCNNARNAFPELMRGTTTRVENGNANVLVLEKTYEGKTITVVLNISADDVKVKGLNSDLSLKHVVCLNHEDVVTQTTSSLKMPKYSIAILA